MPLVLAHWMDVSPRNSGPLSVRSIWDRRMVAFEMIEDAHQTGEVDRCIDLDVERLAVEVVTTMKVRHGRPRGSASDRKSADPTTSCAPSIWAGGASRTVAS